MIKIISIILLLVNATLSVANADSKNLLDRLPKDYNQLTYKEVGRAKFSVLFWDIYNSTLYTKSGQYLHGKTHEPLLFKIEYLKDISTDYLLERTIEQWQHLQIPESQYSPFIPKLKAIWPNISAGDSLVMLVKNEQSVFYFNNVKVGVIQAPEFSRLFLDIWLSPKTSQTKLRAQLLGENINDDI